MRSSRASLAAACLLLVFSGCGRSIPPDENVPLDKVPPEIMKKAQEQLPGYTFTAAWKKVEDGKDVFEIVGKDRSGRKREVEFTPAGELVGVE